MLKGRALRNRLRQPADELWDRWLGVHTFGYNPGRGEQGRPGWASHYEPIAYRDLFRALHVAGLDRASSFTDLGCGLGRGLFAAAWMGAGRVTGVELVPDLARRAEANRSGGRLRTRPIRVIEGDAADHRLGDATHVYFFHSFGPDVIEAIFARARAERAAMPARRPLRLIYANPVENDTIARLGWFRQTHVLPARRQWMSSANHYDFAIWEATDQDR